MIWITGDHHFHHANIIKYCNRPFDNVDQMNVRFIEAWNDNVQKGDLTYYLGDFTLGNGEAAYEIMKQLNGNIIVLLNHWHHDSRWIFHNKMVELEFAKFDIAPSILVKEPKELVLPVPVVMCHYPFEVWDRKHYGAIHFHGHSHGELHRIHNRLDVGVDMAHKLLGSYRPFSLHEAVSLATGYYEEGYHDYNAEVSINK